jgi:hypothetical protein
VRVPARALRRIFGSEMEEVARGSRRLHTEELHNLYASSNTTRLMKSRKATYMGHVALMREMRKAYDILVGKPEGKRPLGRRRCRWEGIRMDLRESGWKGVDWMHLAQDRSQWRALVNMVMNLRFP